MTDEAAPGALEAAREYCVSTWDDSAGGRVNPLYAWVFITGLIEAVTPVIRAAERAACAAEAEAAGHLLPLRWKAGAPVPEVDVPGHGTIHNAVRADIDAREARGNETYGKPHRLFNGFDGLMEAYEELLDMLGWMRQEIEERKIRDAAIAASERDRLASHFRSVSPWQFLADHGLGPGAGAGELLCAAAEEIDGAGVCERHSGPAQEITEGSGESG